MFLVPKYHINHEIKSLFSLAIPIFIAQLAYTSMGFVDAVMAGQVSKHDLAAIALGNSIWVPLFLLMTGIILATTPKVAKLYGECNNNQIGPLVRQSLWMAFFICLIAVIALCSVYPLLISMGSSQSTAALTMEFLYGIAFGLPAIAFYQVLRCLNDGIGRPRPSMVLGVIGLLLNIPVNYVLVFGKLGFPAMGGAGCGWASGIVMWFMFLGLLWWTHHSSTYKPYEVFACFNKPNKEVILSLLKVGIPIGVAVFTEVSIFSVIALLIAKLGDGVVSGHMIALNCSSIIFMIPYSFSIAITVRVGQAVGRKDFLGAKHSACVGMSLAFSLSCISMILTLLFKSHIAGLYTNDPFVSHLATQLIILSALYQLPDAIQVTAAGALRGYQDTRIIMLITLVAYWVVAMPIGYTLALTDTFNQPMGPQGFWISLIIGLVFASVMLGSRFLYQSKHQINIHTAN